LVQSPTRHQTREYAFAATKCNNILWCDQRRQFGATEQRSRTFCLHHQGMTMTDRVSETTLSCRSELTWLVAREEFIRQRNVLSRPKAVIGPGGPSYASKAGAINARKSRVAEHLLPQAASPNLSTSSWWLGGNAGCYRHQ
jgi:hypothetical protein